MAQGNPNGNPQNLRPFNKMDEETKKKIQSKGGKASGESKRARKTFKEELLLLLENGDNQKKISVSLMKKALSGDIKAFEVIRDTIGEKPTDKQEVKVVNTDWFIDEEDNTNG